MGLLVANMGLPPDHPDYDPRIDEDPGIQRPLDPTIPVQTLKTAQQDPTKLSDADLMHLIDSNNLNVPQDQLLAEWEIRNPPEEDK